MLRRSHFFLLSLSLLLVGCDHIPDPAAQPGSWQTLGTYSGTPYFLVTLTGNLYAGLSAQNEQDPANKGFKRLVAVDPTTGALTERAVFPGEPLFGASYFVVNNKLYAGLGVQPDNPALPGVAQYNPNFYAYDPTTNSWQQMDAPPKTPSSDPTLTTRLTEATSLTYGNKGVVLFGVYRTESLNATANNEPFSYADGLGWGRNTVTLSSAVPIPNANDDLNRYYSVFRRGGFGFTLNNRIYTGGGRAHAAGPTINTDRIARDLWGFTATERVDGKGLDLTLQERITTPSADINLTNASQAFVHNNKAYIIGNIGSAGGSLISFMPNEWKLVSNSPQNLSLGAGLGNKLYFLANGQLLSYVPE